MEKTKMKPDESLYCDWFLFHFFLFSFQYSSTLTNLITWKFLKVSFPFFFMSGAPRAPLPWWVSGKPLRASLLGRGSFPPQAPHASRTEQRPAVPVPPEDVQGTPLIASLSPALIPVSCCWLYVKEPVPLDTLFASFENLGSFFDL